jgi:hypothetical protein
MWQQAQVAKPCNCIALCAPAAPASGHQLSAHTPRAIRTEIKWRLSYTRPSRGVNDCADEKRWRIAGERVRSRGARANPKAGDAKINSCARRVTAPPVVICYSLNCGGSGDGGI